MNNILLNYKQSLRKKSSVPQNRAVFEFCLVLEELL